MANFIEDLMTNVDTVLGTYIGDTFQNITAATGTFITGIVTIYFIFLGIGVWTGKVEMRMSELITRVLKISTALGFFLSWPLFNDFVVSFITNTPDALAAKATGSSSGTITGALGTTFQAGMDFVGQIFSSGGWGLQYILGFVVMLCVLAQSGYALFLIVLSKIALSLLLGFAPLFLVFLLFDSMKRMVDTWIQQMVNYSLVIILTIGVLTITTTLVDLVLGAAAARGDTDLGTVAAPSLVLVIATLILMQVSTIAASIAGGFQISTMGGAAASARMSALAAMMSGKGGAKLWSKFRSRRSSGGSVEK